MAFNRFCQHCPFWPDDGMCRFRDCNVYECPTSEFPEVFKKLTRYGLPIDDHRIEDLKTGSLIEQLLYNSKLQATCPIPFDEAKLCPIPFDEAKLWLSSLHSFIFRTIWNEETDETLLLTILELQVSRNADHHPSFFAIYNMETTEIITFYQNSAEELYQLLEKYCDHFYATSKSSSYMSFISSHSNNIHALDQLRSIKSKAGNFPLASPHLLRLRSILSLSVAIVNNALSRR
ncbi:hypothetical protein ACFE04_007799 [Oxalis oulophora]